MRVNWTLPWSKMACSSRTATRPMHTESIDRVRELTRFRPICATKHGDEPYKMVPAPPRTQGKVEIKAPNFGMQPKAIARLRHRSRRCRVHLGRRHDTDVLGVGVVPLRLRVGEHGCSRRHVTGPRTVKVAARH